MSRGHLIREVANQDGGAHIDAVLRGGYERLIHQQSLNVVSVDVAAPIGPPNPSLPMVRQIAYEVDATLRGADV
jgi:hypothetical protein